MKKAIIAAAFVIFVYLLSIGLKIDPLRTLTTMIAYWVFLDRLERHDNNEQAD